VRVQDPYSVRCMPQVHGACRDLLADVERKLVVEMNAVTDNPLVFADTGEVISGGNFHGEPMAFAADVLALAAAELGAIAERRLEKLTNHAFSGLPPFLVEDAGLNSGFMIAQVTAAALASESKGLCHPASVDSIPTSADKEDHVSMGMGAALKLGQVVANTRRILAIELLAAAQGIDLLRPLRSSAPLERLHAAVRERVPRPRGRGTLPGRRGRRPRRRAGVNALRQGGDMPTKSRDLTDTRRARSSGPLTAMLLLAGLLAASGAAAAAEHRLGIGQLYWRSLDDIGEVGLEEDGVAPFLTYQYVPEGIFRLELDVEYYGDGFAGSDSAAYSPVGFVLVELGLYAGVGMGVTVSDGLSDNVSDPFYAARVGWDFTVLPRLHVDVNVNYRANTFEGLEDYDRDSLTVGAAARVAF
jgi:hypothetical protein